MRVFVLILHSTQKNKTAKQKVCRENAPRAHPREALTCVTSKGGWEDRSDVSCPAYGFRCGIIREQSGAEG